MSEFELSAGVYSPNSLSIMKGEGAIVWDSAEKKYIDCVGGHGVTSVGHSNPKVAEAVKNAWENYAFATARHPHAKREEFLEKLSEKMPFEKSKIFLSNSGAEAVEAALKFARLATGRTKILAAKRSFHGRTFGALSATWRPEFREPFEPLVPDFDFFAFNKVDSLAEKIDRKTAAVILEVVQGEGGVHIATKEFLDGVRKLCDENGTLLIIDEVQSGICRTGKFLALENFGAKPDIVCLAKALGGGYPIGATVFRANLFGEKNIRGRHASTFGGNLPACAAALAVLGFCEEENLCEKAQENGEFLKSKLEEISSPKIREIRGIGLMLAIDLKIPAKEIVGKLQEEGVLVLQTGAKTIRLLPPLVISKEEIGGVVAKIQKVLMHQQA
ncbi:acetylornithine/succinylornithine family transaminase [Candidatus Gracilibacteria bacterium]|nr:acetylornithine/succinylornithine family transaminase [Candidatus Gracilibacteria bacterium]